MKSSTQSQSQRGVALVITLVMLAVVTFMAVTFLSISRRQRASVDLTEQQTMSKSMAEAALARAQAEVVAQMLVQTNLITTNQLIVSTNFINRWGFDATLPADKFNATNVNYEFITGSTRRFTTTERLRMLANLFYDPRPPVYVMRPNGGQDFPYYLDLNRNGVFETNGLLPEISPNNTFYDLNGKEVAKSQVGDFLTNFFVGDPEWIGRLLYPDRPHASDNPFIGRYAYVIMPVSKSLDFNYIHNNARLAEQDPQLKSLGYYRNQGVGSWELNLAAFLADVNTNLFAYLPGRPKPYYYYNGILPPLRSDCFDVALGMLGYRYAYDYTSLSPANYWFGTRGTGLKQDLVDTYADGPVLPISTLWSRPLLDNDDPTRPWAGSYNTNGFFSINDLWDTNKVPALFQNAMVGVARPNPPRLSSYNRYTFYRLLSQIGMDSVPGNTGKLDINYDNVRYAATNMEPWNPVSFFTAAAERLFEISRRTNYDAFNRPIYYIGDTVVGNNFAVTNILVYSSATTNFEYTASIHRLLQVAANLYDATTNKYYGSTNALPSVFKPQFYSKDGEVYITNFVEVTNTLFLTRQFRDLNIRADRDALRQEPDANVYGIPLVIGAKKGLPNFNEFSLKNVTQMSRKLELRKKSATDTRPSLTNQMYLLTITNQFGIESWNSYTQAWSRKLKLSVGGNFYEFLTSVTNTTPGAKLPIVRYLDYPYGTNLTITAWPSNQFKVPIFRSVSFLSNMVYNPNGIGAAAFTPSTTNDAFKSGFGFYLPEWTLMVTNRFYYALVDVEADRIIDYVSLNNMYSVLDVTREMAGREQVSGPSVSEPPNTWRTNRVGNVPTVTTPTEGVLEQVEISLGNVSVSEQQWTSFSRLPVDGLDKTKSIDALREFVGLTPLVYQGAKDRLELRRILAGKTSFQTGYNPTRKLYQDITWQANDPLVHYHVQDLLDPFNPPNDPNKTNSVRFAVPPQINLTNSNLGLLNERYRPWGGNPMQSSDALSRDARVKDPMVEKSDDWEFPTNKFPSLGWIGRVHRGTPWLTVYLKSDLIDARAWLNWAGNSGTHPTNDWRLVEVFTTAPNDNAARGLLSVNQTNIAAWSAVLSGVTVLTNVTPFASRRTNTAGAYMEMVVFPDMYVTNLGPQGLVNTQLRTIVAGLNRTRAKEPYGVFSSLGRVLRTPELTFASPYINTNNVVNELALERIPQQILSLLHEPSMEGKDFPRFAVYCYGQALRPAANSVYLGPGNFYKLCTNYQVSAEFSSKTVFRVEGSSGVPPRVVVESFNEIPSE